jgi:signal transduction histidine kinase
MSLAESKLFSGLPAGDLDKLGRLATEVAYRAGDCIFREGDPGDAVYVVKSGWVQISARSESGQRLMLSRILPAEIFGEMAMLDSQPRSATACVEEPSVVYCIPCRELLGLIEESPRLALAVMRAISLRLRDFNYRYVRSVLTTERMALIGRFASSIVHDLKSPLGSIVMAIELGSREKLDAESRQMCREVVLHQVDRIQNLVNDIIEFTRGTSTGARLTPTDYGVFVKSVVGELEPETKLNNVRLGFEPPAMPVKVALHAHRLSRVFHNLVHNAVEAMPHGGQILLRVQPVEGWVLTEIADNGPGLPGELMEKLFEPFATHGKATGTGLGLSICRKAVQEHGGEITARNQPGGGAVFSFTLPQVS